MNKHAYKVMHGFQASAGQPGLLAKGLRDIGIDAFNVVLGPNRFGYYADYVFQDASRSSMRQVLADLASGVDLLHIHAITPFFVRGMPNFPMGTDLLALKAAGKRIIVHFRGSEIRLASVFSAASPYHYVEDDPEGLIAKFPEEGQRTYIDLCRALADEIVVSDPELLSYVPEAKIIRRAIDLQEWPRVGLSNPHRPLVVHAPSRKGVKGTRHVLAAVERLKNEGLQFDFQLVEGLPQEEARRVYERSDIIVDQLRIGWYGVLAVEGMALGKAVVSYIRDDLLDDFDGAPPVYVANPDTIAEALRELITSPRLCAELAQRGHDYCRTRHEVSLVAQSCAKLYEAALEKPAAIDLRGYLRVNEVQETYLERALLEAKKRGAANARASQASAPVASVTVAAASAAAATIVTVPYWRKVYGYYRKVGPKSFLRKVASKVVGTRR